MSNTINNKTVIIYQSELEYISRYTLDYPNIETGGQLFGFWNAEGVPVVTFVIGPGKNANHEIAFFQQDIDYLEKIGYVLTNLHGLKHIGEWHSHHTLGLAQPSGHDAENIQSKVDEYDFSQFLLCIGTIRHSTSSVAPYIFVNSGNDYSKATWNIIKGVSPSRAKIEGEDILLLPKTKTANYSVDCSNYLGNVSMPDNIHKVESYWFADKKNHPILKKIIDEISRSGADKCHVFMDDDNHVFLEISENKVEIEVLFPDNFPQAPPIIRGVKDDMINNCMWKYDGDLYNSFVKYYKQLIK